MATDREIELTAFAIMKHGLNPMDGRPSYDRLSDQDREEARAAIEGLDAARAEPSPEGEPSAEAVEEGCRVLCGRPDWETYSEEMRNEERALVRSAVAAAYAIDFPARSTERAEPDLLKAPAPESLSDEIRVAILISDGGETAHRAAVVAARHYEAALAERYAAAIQWANAERGEAHVALAEARAEVERLRGALVKASRLLPPEHPEKGGDPDWLAADKAAIFAALGSSPPEEGEEA